MVAGLRPVSSQPPAALISAPFQRRASPGSYRCGSARRGRRA